MIECVCVCLCHLDGVHRDGEDEPNGNWQGMHFQASLTKTRPRLARNAYAVCLRGRLKRAPSLVLVTMCGGSVANYDNRYSTLKNTAATSHSRAHGSLFRRYARHGSILAKWRRLKGISSLLSSALPQYLPRTRFGYW